MRRDKVDLSRSRARDERSVSLANVAVSDASTETDECLIDLCLLSVRLSLEGHSLVDVNYRNAQIHAEESEEEMHGWRRTFDDDDDDDDDHDDDDDDVETPQWSR